MNPQWITIASFLWHAEALLAKSRLDSAGIECQLADEHVGRMAPYALAVGGIKLQVRPDDHDAAHQVLHRPSIVK